jgi:hypothetical protein
VDLVQNVGPVGAALLAVGGLVAVIAAVLIAIRNARTKGRASAIAEADALEAEIAACRDRHIADSRLIFELRSAMAANGLDPP